MMNEKVQSWLKDTVGAYAGPDDQASNHDSRRLIQQVFEPTECDQCQRNINSDNRPPFQPCLHDCFKRPVGTNPRRSARIAKDQRHRQLLALEDEVQHCPLDPGIQDVSARLDQVETKLGRILATTFHDPEDYELDSSSKKYLSENKDDLLHSTTASTPNSTDEDSTRHSIDQVESHVRRIQPTCESEPTTPPFHQSSRTFYFPSTPDSTFQECKPANKPTFLSFYGIEPNRALWDGYMEGFIDEVHVMYPIMHLPTLQRHYEYFWNDILSVSVKDRAPSSRRDRLLAAQILLCLAIGRCAQFQRLKGDKERHDPDLSLYHAALDLFGDMFISLADCLNPLDVPQTLTLMAVFLFHLDLAKKTESLLTLAVSHLHHLGLHRENLVFENMTRLDSEMCRRLWWCIDILGHRMVIKTGRSFSLVH